MLLVLVALDPTDVLPSVLHRQVLDGHGVVVGIHHVVLLVRVRLVDLMEIATFSCGQTPSVGRATQGTIAAEPGSLVDRAGKWGLTA